MGSSTPSRMAVVLAAALVLAMCLPTAALGHAERDATFPDGSGTTPDLLLSGPTLLVCKRDTVNLLATLPIPVRQRNERLYRQCMDDGFRHIQAAVDAVTRRDSRILVLPGVYREEPSLRAAARGCDELQGGSNGDDRGTPGILTYEQQRVCPHVQNLIGIFGDSDGNRTCDLPQCGLQIQGTGARPGDVVIDGGFRILNGIRADRVDGARFSNFTLQRFEFNALYVLETDGFLIDQVVGRWNDEYAFLTFAVDHGLYQRCEGYGNGDSAVYPGSASDIHRDAGLGPLERFAVEIRNCRGHHNALGYSGTAGNAVWAHDNRFDSNSTGIVTDSIFPNHPGLPQDHARFENNRIFSNNRNYVKYVQNGRCDRPFIERGYEHGIVCPVIPAPIGSGIVIAGGNYNLVRRNSFFDNWRTAMFQFYVPAALREEPEKEGDTSHFNRYHRNRLGFGTGGHWQPNGLDVWWDDQGEGNCWQDNVAKRGDVRSNAVDPRGLPDCANPSPGIPINAAKSSQIGSCATYDRNDESLRHPPGCDFFDVPARPAGREPARPALDLTRGRGAVSTAVGVSRRAFPHGTDAVVIAAADHEPSALAAAPLAGKVGGPLLLTSRRTLSRATADEVNRLRADRAYVVGPAAPRVRRMLRDVGVRQVWTIRGANRYATAARVARRMGGTEVYIVRGTGTRRSRTIAPSFPIAGLAASQQRPILFAGRDVLPAATANALRDLPIVNATLIGGTRRMSDRVEAQVRRRVRVVQRLSGTSRYFLSAKAGALARQGIADPRRVWVASGASGIDTLPAAAASAQLDGIVVMVDPTNLNQSPAARNWLRSNRRDMHQVIVVGSTARISDRARDQIRTATSP